MLETILDIETRFKAIGQQLDVIVAHKSHDTYKAVSRLTEAVEEAYIRLNDGMCEEITEAASAAIMSFNVMIKEVQMRIHEALEMLDDKASVAV